MKKMVVKIIEKMKEYKKKQVKTIGDNQCAD